MNSPQLSVLLSEERLAALSVRYQQYGERGRQARSALDATFLKEPETRRPREAAAQEIGICVRPIAISQALEDPELRRVIVEALQDPVVFREFQSYYSDVEQTTGLAFSRAQSVEELLARLREAEPFFQERFQRIGAKLAVPEDAADQIAVLTGAAVMRDVLTQHLATLGYVYDAVGKGFLPRGEASKSGSGEK